MRSLSRRKLITGVGAALASGLAAREPVAETASAAPPLLNDASRLNPVPVARHVVLRANEEERFIAELRAQLRAAAAEGRAVCVGGARHSMGGQSLARDGVALTLPGPLCEPDAATRTYRVRGGARGMR
jgi:hypothetical protein